jgi:hypothetical protein
MTPPLLRSLAAESGVSVASNRLTARALAVKYGVTVSQVRLMLERIVPLESGKRGYQWAHAELAAEFQAEKVKFWAEIYGDKIGLSARRMYEYAAAWNYFHNLPAKFRLHYSISAWCAYARYYKHEGATETFMQWVAEGGEVGKLEAMFAERFGKEATPATVRRNIGALQKRAGKMLVDYNGNLPERARRYVKVAARALSEAGKAMEAQNG